MTKVEELEKAVTSLPEEEYSQFRQWFLDGDWDKEERCEAESRRDLRDRRGGDPSWNS
jgi:hypothetical protein